MDQFEKEECIRELAEEKTRKTVEKDAILKSIRMLLLLGHSEDCIQNLILNNYDISVEEVKRMLALIKTDQTEQLKKQA